MQTALFTRVVAMFIAAKIVIPHDESKDEKERTVESLLEQADPSKKKKAISPEADAKAK